MIQTLFGSLKEAEEPKKPGFLERMRQAVTRTRENLSQQLEEIVALTVEIDEKALDELELSLIAADLGVLTAQDILAALRERALNHQIRDGAELKSLLRTEIKAILDAHITSPRVVAEGPEVILLVGVNGTGKTTTSGKLAAWYRRKGKSVLLCAADTFRAAAIEQLEVWGQRTGVEIIKTRQGGDPAAVLYDALNAAKSRRIDVLLVDTAGRLHTKNNLMLELDKMRRTTQRFIPDAPHEVLLVMDATTGQNGLQQAKLFTESAGVTGIVLPKLDGTAKGGVAVAISRELALPVRFVGVGEKLDDLLPFDSAAFTDSLLGA